MDYKVLTSNYAEGLTTQVKSHIETGWKPLGSHQVVINHVQNRYSGSQHQDSVYKTEYSQTMIKE